MIADLDPSICNGCGVCVQICPANVFDMGAGTPVIARTDDCQTCFLCELYCETDAIYVDPDCEAPVAVDREQISPLRGKFRRESGWGEQAAEHPNLHWRMDEIFRRAREA
ncbi:4Fe-4S dicluster domain-containing protein [Asticcacaulis endophyticus]|uniref:4Fe-4S ferredoxin n=1 Tax=Asticcacaulis endophyticus TaxID=1395890 RepID=A0A918URX5_9CAUL|nr:ferredoxin family protein [Asticcacaulis endophyticus]GGZ30873.1 4Fe-4S ferredoxin [Asticcacaulis endophyticus]